jgi:hypothetical protein
MKEVIELALAEHEQTGSPEFVGVQRLVLNV